MFTRDGYSDSGIRSYFSCSKTPKLEQITALNFSDSSKLVSIRTILRATSMMITDTDNDQLNY